MAKIVVSDPLATEGFDLLKRRGHEAVDITQINGAGRKAHIAEAEGWVVRSGTQLKPEDFQGAPLLRGVGRAGVGVDNVDLKAATGHGVAVFNAPTGNITSACEQAWALLLAGARRVVEADNAMKGEDWARKRLKGVELAGKTVFIVGLGKIGRMMAARAQAFEMTTIGYDPFVTPEAAASFGVEWMDLPDGFAAADVVSLHTPLVSSTKDMINEDTLARFKDGSILINAARGGLMDPGAVLTALESGKLAFAGIDVWPEEPPSDWALAKHPKVIAAPHLGASTKEAQVKAALQACERLCDFLDSGDAGLAVNAVATVPDSLRTWADLTESLAAFATQTVAGLSEIIVSATPDIDAEALKVSAMTGALRATVDYPVNAINAPGLAQEKGWTVAARTLPADDEEYVRVEVRGKAKVTIEGTATPHYGPRVTNLDGYDVEFRPEGRFLVTRHKDVPGVLAKITALLAEADVNVASVSLARHASEGTAMAVIKVDGGIPKSARDGLRGLTDITEAHRIRID